MDYLLDFPPAFFWLVTSFHALSRDNAVSASFVLQPDDDRRVLDHSQAPKVKLSAGGSLAKTKHSFRDEH
jgi:hypothetical protein